MQFLLSVHLDESQTGEFGPYTSAEEMEQAFADTGAFNAMLQEKSHWIFAGGLQSPTTAQRVDARGAEPVSADGPHLPGPEALSGLWIIEAADMDEALALAAAGSTACRGEVEVRPFHGV